ncbi:uncharacterized protein PAF06_014953 [Gastrophryne carolinensis]
MALGECEYIGDSRGFTQQGIPVQDAPRNDDKKRGIPSIRAVVTGNLVMLKFAFFIIWTAIGVAFIVVGAVYLNQCPAERYIPIYMIVAGAFSFAYWVLLPLKCISCTLWKIAGLIVSLFVFAWFIAGSVWVFRIYNPTDEQCYRPMYLFVFSILIIQYILIGIGLIAMVFSCLCCENSMFSKLCSCFNSCEESDSCGACGGCLQCCNCLQCCKSIQCSRCLDCCKCSRCCRCFDCCLTKA